MTIVFFTDKFDSCLEEKKMLDQRNSKQLQIKLHSTNKLH